MPRLASKPCAPSLPCRALRQVAGLAATGGAFRRDRVVPALTALSALVGAFDEAGVAAAACAELEIASEIAANVSGKVTAAAFVFVGQNDSAWAELVDSLGSAEARTCTTLPQTAAAPARYTQTPHASVA